MTYLNSGCFVVTADVNKRKIKLFYDSKEKIRLELSNNIIISNNKKTSKYIIDSNELYIDYSDLNFNNNIISLLNINKTKKYLKLVSNTKNTYFFKNKFKYGETKLFFNHNCSKIDSILIKKDNNKFLINNIYIDTLYVQNLDSLFDINYNDKEMMIYDFRN